MIDRGILTTVYQELLGLTGAERSSIIAALATRYQKSPATINRWANQAGMRCRKERSDKGRSSLTNDQVLLAGSLVYSSRRLSNRTTLPIKDAHEILEDSGIITTPVSSSWLAPK